MQDEAFLVHNEGKVAPSEILSVLKECTILDKHLIIATKLLMLFEKSWFQTFGILSQKLLVESRVHDVDSRPTLTNLCER